MDRNNLSNIDVLLENFNSQAVNSRAIVKDI